MPGRPTAGDFEDEVPRRRGRREDYQDDIGEAEDEPAFEEEVEDRPRRHRDTNKHKQKARHAEEEEEEDEDEEIEERPRRHKHTHKHKHKARHVEEEGEDEGDEDDDDHGKQLVLHPQRKKKSGKEVARRKKHETDEEESSSEDEKAAKRKAKKKSKSRKNEMIVKKAWEPVPVEEMDQDFVDFICLKIGQQEGKVWECVEDGLIVRHAETGEYDIDACFDKGNFSTQDKKKWEQAVSKLRKRKDGEEILFCSAVAKGPGYGPSYGPAAVFVPAVEVAGHRRFNPHCRHCLDYGMACAVVFSGFY